MHLENIKISDVLECVGKDEIKYSSKEIQRKKETKNKKEQKEKRENWNGEKNRKK